MKKIIFTSMFLCYCKPYDQDTKSLLSGDDEVKIAINYLGDTKCTDTAVKNKNAGMNEHKLDGANGELAVEEFKATKQNDDLLLSGDQFLEDNSIERSIDAIEDNCRRLILSIDADTLPTITVTTGKISATQQQFARDFAEFKPFTCQKDFCTSSRIENGKRYFAYIEPADSRAFSATINYTYSGKNTNNQPITLTGINPRTEVGEIVSRCFANVGYRHSTGTVSGEYSVPNCQQRLTIATDSKDYMVSNNVRCQKDTQKGWAILIGNNERIVSDCDNGDKFINLSMGLNGKLQITSSANVDGNPKTSLVFDLDGNFEE